MVRFVLLILNATQAYFGCFQCEVIHVQHFVLIYGMQCKV